MAETNNLPNLRTRQVLVTPAMAAHYLEQDKVVHHNRPLYDWKVADYARQMKAGLWRLHHQGLAIGDNHEIIDGQHRLWAVVLSDCTVAMLITTGVPRSVQAVIDDGLRRQPRDVLALAGAEGATAATVAILGRMVQGVSADSTLRPSKPELVVLWKRYEAAIMFAARDAFKGMARRKLTTAGVLAPVARAYQVGASPERLREFGVVLLDGMATEEGDKPGILLRNWLLAQDGRMGGGGAQAMVYRKASRALYSFLQREPLGRLYETAQELFPIAGEERQARKVAKVTKELRERQQLLFANGQVQQ